MVLLDVGLLVVMVVSLKLVVELAVLWLTIVDDTGFGDVDDDVDASAVVNGCILSQHALFAHGTKIIKAEPACLVS